MGRRVKLLLVVVVAAVTTAAVVLGVVTLRSSPEEAPAPAPSDEAASPAEATTPLEDLDTATLAIARQSFCDRVPEEVVEEALGGTPAQTDAYDNGDQVRVGRGTPDVSHEFGCLWKDGKTIARGWVFAPPVTPGLARDLARDTRREDGCEPVAEAAAYGDPSAAVVCPTTRGFEVSYRGLFGDAWLACSLSDARSAGREAIVERAEQYCSSLLQSAATG